MENNTMTHKKRTNLRIGFQNHRFSGRSNVTYLSSFRKKTNVFLENNQKDLDAWHRDSSKTNEHRSDTETKIGHKWLGYSLQDKRQEQNNFFSLQPLLSSVLKCQKPEDPYRQPSRTGTSRWWNWMKFQPTAKSKYHLTLFLLVSLFKL